MSASTKPVFPIWSRRPAVTLTAAVDDYTGVHANYAALYTAQVMEELVFIHCAPRGANASKSTVRYFINSGGVHTDAAYNKFWGEIQLPITTVTAGKKIQTVTHFLEVPIVLMSGDKLYVGLSVVANWDVHAWGKAYEVPA